MLVGAVLCGGRSSRMGTDKALVEVDGVPMARRVADALAEAGCTEVVAVGGDTVALARHGLRVVPDRWPGEGPVGGVLTALRAFPDASAVAVLACDLPHISGGSLRRLVEALDAAGDAAVAAARTDRMQPMCAVWRQAASTSLADALEAGERRLHRVVASLVSVEVALPHTDLLNVNEPTDLPSRLSSHVDP